MTANQLAIDDTASAALWAGWIHLLLLLLRVYMPITFHVLYHSFTSGCIECPYRSTCVIAHLFQQVAVPEQSHMIGSFLRRIVVAQLHQWIACQHRRHAHAALMQAEYRTVECHSDGDFIADTQRRRGHFSNDSIAVCQPVYIAQVNV